eukprot:TRINITY_DN2678_c0_g1_i2.p1 TRINITY_DN2678_c0_g1~~TRINITY_DN2678_c0_g1_i2.p1  ORF type:complete len:236 (-),score=32.50 TRINITY_DN2678_c0_g1_i2:86-793(-)
MKVLALAVLFIATVACMPVDDANQVGGNNSWDYLLYTTRWPYVPSNGDPVPSNVTTFSLHGMWPNRNDTSYPSYCTNEAFDLNKIASLIPTLVEIWYDFEHPNDPSEFWSHEWDKHGTCATSDSLMSTQYDFFNAAIKLQHSVFPIEKALANAGITPSTTPVSLSSFQQAITKGIGALPLMTCHVDSYNNVYVERIQFCVSKSLQLFTCDAAVTQEITSAGQCGSGDVYFPAIPR